MTITATIIADSIRDGARLTTLQLRYPRFIHAEFMTHRVFSRNASSSRAIPVERLIADVLNDTAMPIHWGKNQPGMQAREEHTEEVRVYGYGLIAREDGEPGGATFKELGVERCGPMKAYYHGSEGLSASEAWLKGRDAAIEIAEAFNSAGYHKQIVNRLLEPFSHINVVVTATDWENFFALRDHPDAQPEIRVLAQAMGVAMAESEPIKRIHVDWAYGGHLPYVTDEERATYRDDLLPKLSAARCARVSYLTHEGEQPTVESDLNLYSRLRDAKPAHASPFEHQARPARYNNERHRNLLGWRPYRADLGI